jgi:SAM-dependent methyltransferase
MYQETTHCRACGSPNRVEILALGEMPLADGLLTREQLQQPEPRYPLTVCFCEDCSLVQIRENVAAGILFGQDYPYFSSFSPAWLEHCRENALELIASRQLDESSLVIEIASNDGYLLKNFTEQGIPALGIDPVPGPAAAARERGIEVLEAFFTSDLAEKLKSAGKQADVVLANNVLAHVPDLPGFVQGMATILKEDGIIVVECPYVRELIEHCEFDTIYHEHHCYFSVTALAGLFARNRLYLNDVRLLPTHGGSLRLYVQKKPNRSEVVGRLLQEERALGLDRVEYYKDFAERVRAIQHGLLALLTRLKRSGKRVAAYAAAAKGATLLNSSGIGRDLLDYVVDRNRYKQGKYMPGMHLEICEPSRLLEDAPDYVLMLAWNFRDEILRQQSEYCARGGRFIVPIPYPAVLKPEIVLAPS